MTPTKLLIGQILVVFAILMLGLWAATQWAAAMLAYQPELGAPWFELRGLPVYRPWALFPWWFHYDAYAPAVFEGDGSEIYDWTLQSETIGMTVKITYETPVILELQNFVDSDDERILNSDYLVKVFSPAYFSMRATYYGTLDVSSVKAKLIDYIESLTSGDRPNVSDISAYFSGTGVQFVLPITLFAHGYDYRGRQFYIKSESELDVERTMWAISVEGDFEITKAG